MTTRFADIQDASSGGFGFKPPWRRFAFAAPAAAAAVALMLFCARFIGPELPPQWTMSAVEVRLIQQAPQKPALLRGRAVAPHPVAKPKRIARTPPVMHPHKIVKAPHLPPPAVTTSVRGSTAIPAPPAKAGPGIGVGAPTSGGISGEPGLGSGSAGARAIYAPLPIIPDDMRETAFQSVAIAEFEVLADGNVTVVLIKPTPNPRLNEILLATLRRWRFFPAMRDGSAVDSEFEVRIPISVQ